MALARFREAVPERRCPFSILPLVTAGSVPSVEAERGMPASRSTKRSSPPPLAGVSNMAGGPLRSDSNITKRPLPTKSGQVTSGIECQVCRAPTCDVHRPHISVFPTKRGRPRDGGRISRGLAILLSSGAPIVPSPCGAIQPHELPPLRAAGRAIGQGHRVGDRECASRDAAIGRPRRSPIHPRRRSCRVLDRT